MLSSDPSELDAYPSGYYLTHRDGEGRLHRFAIEGSEFSVGRSTDRSLSLDLMDVSRRQFTLRQAGGRCLIRDDDSKHGTYLNGARLRGECEIHEGDVITIGGDGRFPLTFATHSPLGELMEREVEPESASDEASSDSSSVRRYRAVLPTILRALVSSLDLNSVLGMILDALVKITCARRGCLVLEENQSLSVRLCRHASASDFEAPNASAAIIQRTFRTGGIPLMLGDPKQARELGVELGQSDIMSAFCFPLKAYEGERFGDEERTGMARTIGLVYTDSLRAQRPFDAQDTEFIQVICDLAAVQIANARLYERATRDALTGLYNRGSFDANLNELWPRALTSGVPLTFAIVDIDHFKKINDTYLHVTGDAVLRSVSALLRTTIGRAGTPFRYGGEEFAILFSHTTPEQAIQCVERLRQELAERPIAVEREGELLAIPVSVSAGVAWLPSDTVRHPATLVEVADRRLYQAKQGGRNRVTSCD